MIRRARHTRAGMLFQQQAEIRFEFAVSDGFAMRSACEVTDVSARLAMLQAEPQCVWAAAVLEGEVLDAWFRLRSGRLVQGVSDRMVWRLKQEALVVACPSWAVRSLNRRRFFSNGVLGSR